MATCSPWSMHPDRRIFSAAVDVGDIRLRGCSPQTWAGVGEILSLQGEMPSVRAFTSDHRFSSCGGMGVTAAVAVPPVPPHGEKRWSEMNALTEGISLCQLNNSPIPALRGAHAAAQVYIPTR